VIDRTAQFSHHLFEVAQAQWVGHVPAHAIRYHVRRTMKSFKTLPTPAFVVFIVEYIVRPSGVHYSGFAYCDRARAFECPSKSDHESVT
jgi:hypothetical protein